MNIRKKIILNFSVVTIALVGFTLIFIYTLFYEYREEEFQQQQKAKIITTFNFLAETNKIDENLMKAMDRITINNLYDEKLLIFDNHRNLLYSSIDDTPIEFSKKILNNLSPENPWIEEKEQKYDVVGIYMRSNGAGYYGISKAYDVSGYHHLDYLRNVFLLTFIGISVIVVFMSYYLSKKITNPIVALTKQIRDFDFEVKYKPIVTSETKNEVAVLGQRFNELMQRMNEAFSFQKHAVHHISHELKTPIAVLVSNFERIEQEKDIIKIKELIKDQKEDTESLSKIINSLLEIAKTESGINFKMSQIRIDELIFDLVDELNLLYPDFQFSIEYSETIEDENKLVVLANLRLMKAALSNLMINSIQYSSDNVAKIFITSFYKKLQIDFINNGPVINEDEKQYIYQHYFRGVNSKGKRGFGLGLVFIRKILTMHQGEVAYHNESKNSNKFTITLPLS